MNIVVKYEINNEVHTDTHAHIYIYYDIYTTDIAPFHYKSDGILIYKEQTIKPDLVLYMDGKEEITTFVDSSRKLTVLAESSRYPYKVSAYSFSSNNNLIKIAFLFKD